jgi:hypothetical protein
MPRTPNRRGRRRRHEIYMQVVQDIESLHMRPNTESGDQNTHSFEDNEHVGESTMEVLGAGDMQGTLQLWKASKSGYETTCELFSTDDTSVICPIMHEPICSALLDEIPATWPLPDNNCANTVRLACTHTFFVPALALHFLATDMRCPVCRSGASDYMDIASVPLSIRSMYLAKLSGLQQRTIEEEITTNIDPIHIFNVLSDLEVEMRLYALLPSDPSLSMHTATARTRIIFGEQHIHNIQHNLQSSMLALANNSIAGEEQTNVQMTTNFAVHRSFQRLIRSMIARQQEHGGMVCFALTHPLLPLSFRTNQLSVDEAWNEHFTPSAAAGSSIPFYCINIGGTEPLAFLRSVYCTTTHTTTITIDVNVHIIMNISTYVNDVLESLRESIRQHMSIDVSTITVTEASFPTLENSQSLEFAAAQSVI